MYILLNLKKWMQNPNPMKTTTEEPPSESAPIAMEEREKNPEVIQRIEWKSQDGDALEFHRVLDSELQSLRFENYIQVANTPASESLMRMGWQSGLAAAGVQIGAQAWGASGLYRATVSPMQLMKYADGTISSIYRGAGGKIAGHAGFQPAGGAVFAPLVIFQVASIVTGQYYLNGITKQLNAINAKLDRLLQLHHVERIAKIRQTEKIIQKLAGMQCPNVEDLLQLKLVETEIGNLHEEYAWLLSECNPEELQKMKSWRTSSRIKELEEKTGREEIFENLAQAILTDELLHVLPLVEILLNARMTQDREQRARRIGELVAQIREWKKQDFYRSNIQDSPAWRFLDSAIEKATWIRRDAILSESEADALVERLKNQKQEVLQMVSQESPVIEVRDRLLEQLARPREVFYIVQPDGAAAVLVENQNVSG